VNTTDLVVAGSGMGGSIMAMVARRLGRRVVLLERGRHPRFAIGESSSPLAGILIEQLAERYDLPRLAPLAAYGAWQRHYPQLGCGLKRGFTFFRHEAGCRYRTAPDRSNQLLVAASPCDELADTHWLRSDVDAWLMGEAVALGAEYLDECQVERVEYADDGVRVRAVRAGQAVTIEAAGIIDATGPRGCLHRALDLPESRFDGYPATRALFSHFHDVARCEALEDFALSTPGCSAKPPYPIDDAAVHPVFDGGWMWVLRFGNGVTSAGVAVEDWLAAELGLADGAAAWPRLLARFPSLADAFAGAAPVRSFDWQPRLTYRTHAIAGPRWALLPSAAAFVDPLFSTGFPLTLLGIERLGRLLERGLFTAAGGDAARQGLEAYASTTLAEADQAARFVAGCYASFPRFHAFTAYSMFYFAAASFAEASRRLRPDAPGIGFLGAARRGFSETLKLLSPAAHPGSLPTHFVDSVGVAIDPLNVAGLCRAEKRNWYGVEAADLVDGAPKLGVAATTVQAMLRSLGL
jgi:FADH2 O2-dependent halogenase